MTCRVCGCTDDRACVYEDESGRVYACAWVSEALCSACAYWPPVKRLQERDLTEVAS